MDHPSTLTCRFESPYINPDQVVEVEHIVSDEQEEMSGMQQRDEHFDYEQNEMQEQYCSSPRSMRLSWEATRRVAQNVTTKLKSVE